MLTLQQILDFFKTEEGAKIQTQIITDYINNNEEGKALLQSIMGPELETAKTQAVKDWEEKGRGKALKDKNTELLAKIADGKEGNAELEKFINLLDISEYADYNELKNAVLGKKLSDTPDTDLVELRTQLGELQIRNREQDAEIKGLQSERESLNTAVQDSDSYISDMLINDEIKNTLIKQGFDPNQAQGLVNRVSQLGQFKVQKDELNGERKAINEYGLSPEKYVTKEYLVSDEGKAFKPNFASGGGAGSDKFKGGQGGPKTFKDMSWDERNKLARENPDQFRAEKAKYDLAKQV